MDFKKQIIEDYFKDLKFYSEGPTARIVMIVINQEYFLFSSDPYQLQSDIVSNNIYNTIAKVTGMDLI